ncbi:hypothetical protein L1887_62570 [Cichorium endivia]|nr:hypothetical protein L1887_62570 [Cichorium endivia]
MNIVRLNGAGARLCVMTFITANTFTVRRTVGVSAETAVIQAVESTEWIVALEVTSIANSMIVQIRGTNSVEVTGLSTGYWRNGQMCDAHTIRIRGAMIINQNRVLHSLSKSIEFTMKTGVQRTALYAFDAFDAILKASKRLLQCPSSDSILDARLKSLAL